MKDCIYGTLIGCVIGTLINVSLLRITDTKHDIQIQTLREQVSELQKRVLIEK